MKKIMLTILCLMLSITVIACVFTAVSGEDLGKYRPYRVSELLRELSKSETLASFNKTVEMYERADQAIKEMGDKLKEQKEAMFEEGDTLEKIYSFFVWFGSLFTQIFNIIYQGLSIAYGFITDLITQIVWVLKLCIKLFTLVPAR